jgi:hypothetical protein
MNKTIAGLWWGMIVATVAAVVPLALFLLTRALGAARQIERYTADILEHGVGIAVNTSDATALKQTLALAPRLLDGTEAIIAQVSAITTILGGERPGNGHSNSEGGPA